MGHLALKLVLMTFGYPTSSIFAAGAARSIFLHVVHHHLAERGATREGQAAPDLGAALAQYAVVEAVHHNVMEIDVVAADGERHHTRLMRYVPKGSDLDGLVARTALAWSPGATAPLSRR